jgi:hypothetical protein
MQRYDNYDATQAFTGDFEELELGGHICRIKSVECTAKPYGELLTIEFDIAEGTQAGYYQRKFDSLGKWVGKYYQTVKKDDLKFFKGFITAIEKSNPGFKFDFDEKQLVGKLFGGVFGQEEYESNGEVKVSTKCVQVRSVEEIRKGVPVPKLKKLKGNNGSPAFFAVDASDTDDLPFK